ncbi:hypothetical protein [Porcincola intestinalis]|uniref:hypothetical protein n=1 Tax=Porcincola intestinalis TaxID=2606632 RepID=UPI0023F58331|nr:hypothetical protein [Porcincola intestinalis]MDD7059940.1 hypothetical protein [Porcincola intestinalis]MDY4204270.1 hypothetical protein [Porcincola intestinalis]MDY5283879.1 hypothetical protein [Porcincola intestinalis]
MEGITVSGAGLSFVMECFRKYVGKSWEIAVFCLAGMIVSALTIIRSRRAMRADGIYAAAKVPDSSGAVYGIGSVTWMNWTLLIMLGLTVYNPFLVRKLVPKLGMTTVYYRMFWAFPLIPAAAFYLTELIFLPKKRMLRTAACALAAAGIILLMPLNPGVRYHLTLPDNVFKVHGAIPVICDVIHEDFEASEQYSYWNERAEGLDLDTKKGARTYVLSFPRCVFPSELEFQVRQYDPGVILTFNRNMRLFYDGNTSTGIQYTSKSAAYRRRKLILDVCRGKTEGVTTEDFQTAMKKTRTQYLIVNPAQADPSFLKVAGCRLVSETAGYCIYSYGITKEG